MRYDAILRRLFDAGFVAFTSTKEVEAAMEAARKDVLADAGVRALDIRFSEVIVRDEGPMVTACLSREGPIRRFSDIDAAGIVRLRSNHRVIVTRSQRLGKPDLNFYNAQFVEGDKNVVDGCVCGGHQKVPPFSVGNLSDTDQTFSYLMSLSVPGDRKGLEEMGKRLAYPLSDEDRQKVFGDWVTDEAILAYWVSQPKAA